MTHNNDDVMPAGAAPPEPVFPEPELILGKFKSPEDLATGYQELERKIGEQGNELGSMKQMNAMILEQMDARQAQDKTPAMEAEKDAFDYEAQMGELVKGVESGEIPYDQAIKLSANLAAESATRKALTQYEQISAKKELEAVKSKFLTDHPDFIDLQKSGQLESVKKALPGMHDDFSAYFALQAANAKAAAAAKSELDRIAGGDKRTAMVLNKPGAKANEIGKPQVKLSSAQLKAQTLAKLEGID